jgi:dipeptidyl aminopeptidase/acylaminoacyl peptidase
MDLTDGSAVAIQLPEPVMPGWSLGRDGNSMIAEVTGPISPRTLVHLSLPDGLGSPTVARRVFGMPATDLPDVLVSPALHCYRSYDGLELHGWLYRPLNAHGPGPSVISFHGGPESQERPAFSLLTQSLVAAGITVFAPNVRGSSGYGNTFMAADDGAARANSFQDVLATADFLLENGWAQAGSIGVQGWSYGGYLVLTALARWPDRFAAGTTHAGMSDLLSFFAETESWMSAASVTEYGDPVLQADLLRALSPLTHLHQVRSPTLLVHGDQDTNVPVGESVRAHVALKSAGVPTELVLLPGEGHTIVGASRRAELALAICNWFVRWLVPE